MLHHKTVFAGFLSGELPEIRSSRPLYKTDDAQAIPVPGTLHPLVKETDL